MLLVHADWSVAPAKRWAAAATTDGSAAHVFELLAVSSCSRFLQALSDRAQDEPVVAGFDFPIGVPAAYGVKTGLSNFPELLSAIGAGPWAEFTSIARTPDQISVTRPFYPATSQAGLKQESLLRAHNVDGMDALRRACERATAERRAACSLFWTLGGNQVGRAALAGWLEILRPALASGARLWPFAGALDELTKTSGLVLAETYPAEAYGHVGVQFAATESKRRRDDRRNKAFAVLDWAERHCVSFEAPVRQALEDGFGDDPAGEDRFDALLGLLGMVEVATGRRCDAPLEPSEITRWEGWILGQSANPSAAGAPAKPRKGPIENEDVDDRLVAAVAAANPQTRNAIRDLLLASAS